MDIVERLRDPRWIGCSFDAADEIERLRAALKQYRDGSWQGYVTLPCGWDDMGTLASYALEGEKVKDYANDCEYQYNLERSK